MQFERERQQPANGTRCESGRCIVDGFVIGGRDLWLVVAREGERIEDWLHGENGIEVAPLRVCRSLGRDRLILDAPDPQNDRLLSDIVDDD